MHQTVKTLIENINRGHSPPCTSDLQEWTFSYGSQILSFWWNKCEIWRCIMFSLRVTAYGRAGRSPTFQDPGTLLNGLASLKEGVLKESFKRDSDSQFSCGLASTRLPGYPFTALAYGWLLFDLLTTDRGDRQSLFSSIIFVFSWNHICLQTDKTYCSSMFWKERVVVLLKVRWGSDVLSLTRVCRSCTS